MELTNPDEFSYKVIIAGQYWCSKHEVYHKEMNRECWEFAQKDPHLTLLPDSLNDLATLFTDIPCPALFLEKSLFDQNLRTVKKIIQKSGKKIRVATKSLRVPELIASLCKESFVNGLMLSHPNEIEFYLNNYGIQDLLLAYPIVTSTEAEIICQTKHFNPQAKITVMVDSIEHLEIMEQVAQKSEVKIHICIDCDMGVEFGGRYVTAQRSPLRRVDDVVDFIQILKNYPHLVYRGIMCYEVLNAAIDDKDFEMVRLKRKSRSHANNYREILIKALSDIGMKPELVNGGGSGCFQETVLDDAITEVSIGSIFFKSHIFDLQQSMDLFVPSLFMILRVIRKPQPDIATAFSGGFYSSGHGTAPLTLCPIGLNITDDEGWGETNTPFKFAFDQMVLNIGDIIVCRLGKAGEPLERFEKIFIVQNGKIMSEILTNRGIGLWVG